MNKEALHILPFENFFQLLRRRGFLISPDLIAEALWVAEQFTDLYTPGPNSKREQLLRDLENLWNPLFSKTPEQQQLFHTLFQVEIISSFWVKEGEKSPPLKRPEEFFDKPIKEPKSKLSLGVRLSIVGISILLLASTAYVIFVEQSINPIILSLWAIGFVAVAFFIFYYWRYIRSKVSNAGPPFKAFPEVDLLPKTEIIGSEEGLRLSNAFNTKGLKEMDTRLIDLPGTIAKTIQNAGQVSVLHKKIQVRPDYLILIDRTYAKSHIIPWLEYVLGSLSKEGLSTHFLFFDGDPRNCWDKKDQHFSIDEISTTSRLILISSGEALIDKIEGGLFGWATSIFGRWEQRGILTAKKVSDWDYIEYQLSEFFNLAPATLNGLFAIADDFDNIKINYFDDWLYLKKNKVLDFPNLEELEQILPHKVFYWLCACGIYPQLYWKLTLKLGEAIENHPHPAPGTILNRQIISLLTEIKWFREGKIPDEVRWKMINKLPDKANILFRETLQQILDRELTSNMHGESSLAKENLLLNSYTNKLILAELKGDTKTQIELIKQIRTIPKNEVGEKDSVLKNLLNARINLVADLKRILNQIISIKIIGDKFQSIFRKESIRSYLQDNTESGNTQKSRKQESISKKLLQNYIEPYYKESNKGGLEIRKWPIIPFFIERIVNKSSSKFNLVLGDARAGKTSFLLLLEKKILEQNRFNKRHYHETYFLNLRDTNPLQKINEVKNKRDTILLLDGLDENPSLLYDLEKTLIEITSTARDFKALVMTCRTDTLKLGVSSNNYLALHNEKGGKNDIRNQYKVFYLCAPPSPVIEEYFQKKYPGKIGSNLLSMINLLQNFFTYQFFLSNEDLLVKASKDAKYESRVYNIIISAWLHKYAEQKYPSDKYNQKRYYEKLNIFFKNIAVRMSEYGNNYIPSKELILLASNRNVDLEAFEIKPLLKQNPDGEYSFIHKSIYEYFVDSKKSASNEESTRTANKKINVAILDDHKLALEGLQVLLSKEENIEVVAIADNWEEFWQKIRYQKVDVFVIDLHLSRKFEADDGIEIAIYLKDHKPGSKSLIYAFDNSYDQILRAKEAGIEGYILKEETSEELVKAVNSLSSNNLYYSELVTKTFLENEQLTESSPNFTRHEADILNYIANGYNVPQIKDLTGWVDSVIRTHKNNVMQKLNIRNVEALVVWAIENGYRESSNPSSHKKNQKEISLFQHNSDSSFNEEDLPKFTAREEQVLHYISNGYDVQKINEVTGLSRAVIVRHKRNIMEKLNFNNIEPLVAWAIRNGFQKETKLPQFNRRKKREGREKNTNPKTKFPTKNKIPARRLKEFRSLIIMGKIDRVFDLLNEEIKGDQENLTEFILIQSKWNRLLEQEKLGVIDSNDSQETRNAITYSLLNFINNLQSNGND